MLDAMRTAFLIRTPLLACLAAATLVSCAQTAEAPSAGQLLRELKALVGDAACSTDGQCRTVPVGAQACGGPSGYLAWSTATTDGRQLGELSQRQAATQRREVEASGQRSNCAVVPDPGARCLAGHCQLAAPAPGRTP